MYQRQKERNINYRTPLQEWIDVLHVFEDDVEEADKGDDALYLIKQYARLQLSSISQLRADYKMLLQKKCTPDLLRDEIILSILGKLQNKLHNPYTPEDLPDDMDPVLQQYGEDRDHP